MLRPNSYQGQIPGETRFLARPTSWRGETPGEAKLLPKAQSWRSQPPGEAKLLARPTSWRGQTPCEAKFLGKANLGETKFLAEPNSLRCQTPGEAKFLARPTPWRCGIRLAFVFWHSRKLRLRVVDKPCKMISHLHARLRHNVNLQKGNPLGDGSVAVATLFRASTYARTFSHHALDFF